MVCNLPPSRLQSGLYDGRLTGCIRGCPLRDPHGTGQKRKCRGITTANQTLRAARVRLSNTWPQMSVRSMRLRATTQSVGLSINVWHLTA